MSEILVTGGTGHLGRELVPRLVANGHNVRVLSRKPGGPSVIQGDLMTGAGLNEALDGIDVLVHCATGAADSGVRGLGYKVSRKTDVETTERLLKAASSKPHVVYISIVGVDVVPLGYYRAKLDTERVIEASGLPHTIFRATQFHTLAEEFGQRLAKSPIIFAPKGVRSQLVDTGEVAERMAALVEHGPSGRAPDMGGPEILKFTDILRMWLRARKKSRPLVAMPIPGKTMKAFREGGNLTPEHADGKITFEQWLSADK